MRGYASVKMFPSFSLYSGRREVHVDDDRDGHPQADGDSRSRDHGNVLLDGHSLLGRFNILTRRA